MQIHNEDKHTYYQCTFCSDTYLKEKLMLHEETCPQKPRGCIYCNLLLYPDEFNHEDACGSKTEKCNYCEKYIQIKDLDSHNLYSCSKFSLLRNSIIIDKNPEPKPKKKKRKLTNENNDNNNSLNKVYPSNRQEMLYLKYDKLRMIKEKEDKPDSNDNLKDEKTNNSFHQETDIQEILHIYKNAKEDKILMSKNNTLKKQQIPTNESKNSNKKKKNKAFSKKQPKDIFSLNEIYLDETDIL